MFQEPGKAGSGETVPHVLLSRGLVRKERGGGERKRKRDRVVVFYETLFGEGEGGRHRRSRCGCWAVRPSVFAVWIGCIFYACETVESGLCVCVCVCCGRMIYFA